MRKQAAISLAQHWQPHNDRTYAPSGQRRWISWLKYNALSWKKLLTKSKYIVGLACFYHDSAAALIKDGVTNNMILLGKLSDDEKKIMKCEASINIK